MAEPSIVIAAGGTGGHIYPGLALASAIRRQVPDARVTFVGTERGLEGRLIPEQGYPLRFTAMVPFTGKGKVTLPAALVRAAFQSNAILRSVGADVAVGMGGYASIPLIAGAWLGRVPSLIHESGAIPGRANLVAARLTKHIGVAFEEAAPTFPKGRDVRVVGMPLDRGITSLDRAARRDEARAALGLPLDAFVVFVTGGSQGAASLNAAAVGLGARWAGRDDVRVVLKTGRAHHDQIQADIDAAGGAGVVLPVSFFERIEDAYAAADLCISRAGAGTVAELAAVGLPSILVPYPHAPGDHQAINAGGLVRAGGAVLVRDHDATADVLGPMVEELIAAPDSLADMAERARLAGRPDAADDLARWVLDLAARPTRED